MNAKIILTFVSVISILTFPVYGSTVKGDSLSKLAQDRLFNNPDSAAHFSKLAFAQAETDNDPLVKARSLHFLGIVSAVRGDMDSAKTYYQKSLEISEKEGMEEMMSKTYNNLGLAHHEKGEIEEALKYYYKSLAIDEKNGDMEGVNGARINIGRIYSFQERYHDALAAYDSAYTFFKEQGDLNAVSLCLNNKGYIHQQLNDYEQALSCYKEGLEISRQEGDLYSIAARLNNIARLYSFTGKEEQAIELFHEAIRTAQSIGDKTDLIHSHLGLAQLWLDKGLADSAASYASTSLDISLSTGALLEVRDAYEALHQSMAAKKAFKQAYRYYDLYKAYSDSLFNMEKEKELNRLQLVQKETENKTLQNDKLLQSRQLELQKMKIRNKNLYIAASLFVIALSMLVIIILYKTKKQKHRVNKKLMLKNQEIIAQKNILDQQKGQLLEQKEKLRQLNDLKDKTLSVISHDFRSPLIMIQSLLDLHTSDMLSEEELRDHLPIVSRQVGMVSEMLNDMLTWARKQFSDFKIELEPVRAYSQTESAIGQLKPFAEERGIEIINCIPKDVVVYTEEEVFKIIARNLISNAMKFSPNDGKIMIGHGEDEEYHWISVSDEGEGISEEAAQDILNNRIMKDVKKGKNAGIGIFISKQFIEAGGGRLKINSIPGNGATFSFGLPKSIAGKRQTKLATASL